MNRHAWCIALIGTCFGTTAGAADRDEYNRRSAERYVAMFRANDVNRDDVVSRDESSGAIELVARFDDIDINRDDHITLDELSTYIDANFR